MTTLLFRREQLHHSRLVEHVSAYNRVATERLGHLAGIGHGSGHGRAGLAYLASLVDQQAAQLSYLDAFNLFTVVSLLVVPLVVFMRKPTRAAAEAPVH